jgi:hypothetical protein
MPNLHDLFEPRSIAMIGKTPVEEIGLSVIVSVGNKAEPPGETA